MRTGGRILSGAAMRTDGRVLTGAAHALLVWLAALLVIPFLRHVALLWACVAAAVLSTVVLGTWHRRQSRRDTAVGAYLGAVLWPFLTGVAVVVINAVSTSLSDFE
jgi:hypothetical protein